MSASLFVQQPGHCLWRVRKPLSPQALDGRRHLERFAMEQAGEVDYLIGFSLAEHVFVLLGVTSGLAWS